MKWNSKSKMVESISIFIIQLAIVGFILPLALGYRANQTEVIISTIVFAIVGGGVGILFGRRDRFKSQPPTRSKQIGFTIFLLIGCICSLILGNTTFAVILGIATIGAWVSLQRMSE